MIQHAAGLVTFGLSQTQHIAQILIGPAPTLYDAGKGAGNGPNIGRIFKIVGRDAYTRKDGSNKHADECVSH